MWTTNGTSKYCITKIWRWESISRRRPMVITRELFRLKHTMLLLRRAKYRGWLGPIINSDTGFILRWTKAARFILIEKLKYPFIAFPKLHLSPVPWQPSTPNAYRHLNLQIMWSGLLVESVLYNLDITSNSVQHDHAYNTDQLQGAYFL